MSPSAHGEVVGVHEVVELLHVGDEPGGELLRARSGVDGAQSRKALVPSELRSPCGRRPEVLLDAVEAGPVEALGHGVDLAVVDLRVEVAERLGGRLDALVGDAGRREEAAGGLVVAGGVRVGEGLHRRARARRPAT